MGNVFYRKKTKTNFFLSNEKAENTLDGFTGTVAVFVHLFYLDRIDFYFKYLKRIPKWIDVYVSYSDNAIKERAEAELPDAVLVYKENRGRDISALLVAFREICLKYEYVCFLHDKKEKIFYMKHDTDKWIYSLWENMVSNDIYIRNIIGLFEEQPDIGLLVPPIFYSDIYKYAYTNLWSVNYETTKKLIEKFSLNCDINEKISPITQGTCFWVRVKALNKLLEHPWKYEDFPEEPLPDDGTISHSLERSFSYFAQDAGFETGWVMTKQYGGDYIEEITDGLRVCFGKLIEEQIVYNIGDIKIWNKDLEDISIFAAEHKKIYMYGAGKYAKKIKKITDERNVFFDAFVVSDIGTNSKEYLGKAVLGIDDIEIDDSVGFIISVDVQYMNDILAELHKRNVKEKNIFAFSLDRMKAEKSDMPSDEMTAYLSAKICDE